MELNGAAPLPSGHDAAGVAAGPGDFLVGVAISVYQNSGGQGSNWSAFEDQKNFWGRPRILGGQRAGSSNDFWNRYKEDLALAKALNCTFFRFSLEWSRIEPQRGHIDQEAVYRYNQILDEVLRLGMTPMVTLYHFVHPLWFDDLGGFEKLENVPLFVAFSEVCCREFASKVKLWATLNEPNVVAFCGYIYGNFPPARVARFEEAGTLLQNLLIAHADVYDAIKELPGGAEIQVGIVHNHMKYEPKNERDCASLYLWPVCRLLYRVWATDILIDFFQTGLFRWHSPMAKPLIYQHPKPPGLDFIGLNYYGTAVIGWKFNQTSRVGQTMTDMLFPTDAQGLYHGIALMAKLGVPIYITETGIADRTAQKREQFFEEYFGQIKRAVADGYDVRGVLYWTLVDNFEWAHGFEQKFGLYSWEPDNNQTRTLLPSSRALAKRYADAPEEMEELRAEGHVRRQQRLDPSGRVRDGAAATIMLPSADSFELESDETSRLRAISGKSS